MSGLLPPAQPSQFDFGFRELLAALNAGPLSQLDCGHESFSLRFDQPLDALEAELAGGQRGQRRGHRQIRASSAPPV
jgi:hypothetical protein